MTAHARSKAATIYDVAELAQVSISTVSQTLNRPDKVRDTTRERVLRAIRELSYQPKGEAVHQARRGVGRIGVTGPFSCYESYGRRLVGVMAQSVGHDRDIVVYDQQSAAATISPFLRTLPMSGRLDGLIIMGSPVDDDLIGELRRRGLPAVLVDSVHRDLTSVNIDEDGGAGAVADMLIEKGHTRFAFIHEHQLSPDYRSAAQGRLNGFRRAVAAAHLDPDCVLEISVDNSLTASGDAVRQILDAGATAVFANHDLLAAGVLKQLKKQGVRVPDDVAVVGFDDGVLADALDLTTVRQPFEESGRLAASLLTDEIRHPSRGTRQQIHLSTHVVPRATT